MPRLPGGRPHPHLAHLTIPTSNIAEEDCGRHSSPHTVSAPLEGVGPPNHHAGSRRSPGRTYTGKDLAVTTGAGTFTGRVSGARFAFTGSATVSFAKQSTRDVLFCEGNLAAPKTGPLARSPAVLGAGFNRSTLLSDPAQPTTDAASPYSADITNRYAKASHAATQDGRAHGFAFDDVADFAAHIQDTAPTGIQLTRTALQGAHGGRRRLPGCGFPRPPDVVGCPAARLSRRS